jgi:hypothetical protein|tara:strand:+ start:138 stop:602 length:465 start_codon:yes stop_codon:yes gene_type:complete
MTKWLKKDIDTLLDYLEKRDIDPLEARDIIHKSTPEAQEDNKRFNWKMLRFTMYLWERIEQDKKGYLWKKTDTAKAVVESKNYIKMYEAFNNSKYDPKKEAFNLFKLITDPRQKPYLKSRYFVFKNSKNNIPQEIIDYLLDPKKNPIIWKKRRI